MGLKNRGEAEAEACSLSEALLFATMCIVGLPVEVHIRDGSVYSGIFHTASVEGQYGIVLKEARLTRKGKCVSNVANGRVIQTLVILSSDLVQVVAKGVLLPADVASGKIVGDDLEAAVNNALLSEIAVSDVKHSARFSEDKRKINQHRGSAENKNISGKGFISRKDEKDHDGRNMLPHHLGNGIAVEHVKENRTNMLENGQVSFATVNGRHGDDWSKGEYEQLKKPVVQTEKSADELQSSSSSVDTCLTEEKSAEDVMMMDQVPSGVSCELAPTDVNLDNQCCERSSSPSSPDAVHSTASNASSSVLNNSLESHCSSSPTSADAPSSGSADSNKNSKEFKLNPGAKVFSPSFANPLAAISPPLPPFANMAYVPGNSSILPVAAAQPEVGISPFAPRSSIPAKIAPFNNLTTGNGGSSSQFSQLITGNMGSRIQPLRYGGQYHTVQTAPTYPPPNSQAVMVGRLGQLVYVQPVTHDLVQSTASIAPVAARPLLSPHQVQYPKQQGSAAGQIMQVCVPSPFVGVGQQPFLVPGQIPLVQPPIAANCPVPVQGSNPVFGTKFP